jgi:hypothetical protein
MTAFKELVSTVQTGTAFLHRVMLAFASTLYAALTLLSTHVPPPDSAYVLLSGHRIAWGVIFALDGLALWWRIFDPRSRPRWAITINLVTFALWVGISGGTVMVAQHVDPDIVGYVLICIMALHALVRTDLTQRDRETA